MRTEIFCVTVATLLLAISCGAGSDDGTTTDSPVDSQPAAAWFEERAEAAGLEFSHRSGFDQRYLMPEAASGGGGLFDMDGDGDLDAYLVQSGSLVDATKRSPGNQLFENLGDGTFVNVTPQSGADDVGYGMGVACGDYDNDGDVDLYVTNYGPNRLLMNDGTGRFEDRTALAQVAADDWSASAGFLDYDRDGDLDLFVVNYIRWSAETELECYNQLGSVDYCSPKNYDAPAVDRLYRNDGAGKFTDVTQPAGLYQAFGNGLGFAFGDYDADGWLDIFVANDGLGDQLWVNQQDGTFKDEALVRGCAVDLEGGIPKAGMGVTTGDIDNDGDLDLMVCNLVDETDSVYLNEGNFFSDVTAQTGLGTVSRHYTRFGMGWVDFNNDGHYDLFQANGRVMRAADNYGADPYAEPNVLFAGTIDRRFKEQLPRGGTARELIATSRGAAFGDINNDGGVDVLVINRDAPASLLVNKVAATSDANWVTFRVLETSGRDAEGAQVLLDAGGESMRRDVRSGYSYLACNDPRVHFGLADNGTAANVRVVWADGVEEPFGEFEANQQVELRRGSGAR
jgi:hypothetical protein